MGLRASEFSAYDHGGSSERLSRREVRKKSREREAERK